MIWFAKGDILTVTLSGSLNADQEPGPTSDSKATGDATVVITQNLATEEVSYSSELSVVGRNEADLNTPIPGAVSAIHLHNAPVGQNGPVVQDTLVEAGATLNVNASGGTGVIGQDVISNQVETDGLFSIENVVASDDGDVIVGSHLTNALNGEGGDDILIGCNSAISARINPGDINKLKIGQAIRIRLSAFAQADASKARGSLFDITADALKDERTGQSYFKTWVKLNDQQSDEMAALDLVPGQPEDLFVNTGERAVIAYLAQPVSEGLASTFIK
ncbi:CHRD domain-containing protein [Ruegeria marisrubri]|uniref:CHRD domain-containing protein n=1 Tax=Ruegeria marisrubri TaxID=1685379 RepID=UPI001CD4B3D1|nr:CHRD domain-containing protein [Ruegeria marisrubri]MCA0907342.1 CHRD domain-containing protein [Ruegeria marisrubri]